MRFAKLGACLLLLQVVLIKADDWPHWRGLDWNGISKETGWATSWPTDGPKQLWKASVGTGFSSVAVAAGRLFTLGNTSETDTVYCFDAINGKELWKYSYACPSDPQYYEGGPGSTPTVDHGQVFTLSKRGHVFGFDVPTGNIIWKRNLIEELGVEKPRWGFAGSPVVDGDILILNVGSAGTALNKKTGEIVWKSEKSASGYATPILYDSQGERCAAIFSGKALMGVRVKDGKQLWSYPWVEKWFINAADPLLIEGNKVFISSFGVGCALLDISSGQPNEIWANKEMGNHFNSCVYHDGFIYGNNGNTDMPEKDLRCLEAKTGEVKWKHSGFGLGSLIIADGKIIEMSEKGELLIAPASPKSFKPMARAQVLGGKCWTAPVLANARIYCRNAKGDLICLDVR
jgi:outer membrane protein assembly factor BamB